eukprot:scaffold49145_cov22-Phaeocystis_antarctica.AAC.1
MQNPVLLAIKSAVCVLLSIKLGLRRVGAAPPATIHPHPVLLAMKAAVWGLWCSLLQLQCERLPGASRVRVRQRVGTALHEQRTLTRCEPPPPLSKWLTEERLCGLDGSVWQV